MFRRALTATDDQGLQTLWVGLILRLNASEELENDQHFHRPSFCSAKKSTPAEWMNLIGPDPSLVANSLAPAVVF